MAGKTAAAISTTTTAPLEPQNGVGKRKKGAPNVETVGASCVEVCLAAISPLVMEIRTTNVSLAPSGVVCAG